MIPANTRYLFELSGLRPDVAPPHEILIIQAQRIRHQVRQWWQALEPEDTAGISIELLEGALMEFADEAVDCTGQRLGTDWAHKRVAKRLGGSIHGKAEKVIAQRLLDSAERLGVLASGGTKTFTFAHPSLLELYLGLSYQQQDRWPQELDDGDLFSVDAMAEPRGRASWARLAFTERDDRDWPFDRLAASNLHLATWFLACDASARAKYGEAFAASLVAFASWDDERQRMLGQMLTSLGPCCLGAVRERLAGTYEPTLPELVLAAPVLGRFGDEEDVERLRELAADPALGQGEIERMRQAIREAESLTLDPEDLQKARREELVEFGKNSLKVLFLIGGAIVLGDVKVNQRIGGVALNQWQATATDQLLSEGLQRSAESLADGSPNDVLALQRALRERLAYLPAEIAERKVGVERTRPEVQRELRRAADTLHPPQATEPPPLPTAGG